LAGDDTLRYARPPGGGVSVSREMLTLPDGCETLVLRYASPPRRGSRMPLLYLHGIQSHPGWFTHSAQVLARAGHEVFQVTRRGSGEATAARGDTASARQLIEDVDAALDHLLRRTGADRAGAVGVSWGGKLLAAWAVRSSRTLAAMALVAPGIAPRVDIPWSRKLGVAAARLCCPRRRFDIPLNDVSLFTDNPDMRAYLEDDPHRLRRATARFLVASVRLDLTLRHAGRGALRVPTALLLARRDRIIDNAATRAVVERLTAGRVRTFEFDAAHTIEFEPDPEAFCRCLCEALDAPA